jgi:hypothetical protein
MWVQMTAVDEALASSSWERVHRAGLGIVVVTVNRSNVHT